MVGLALVVGAATAFVVLRPVGGPAREPGAVPTPSPLSEQEPALSLAQLRNATYPSELTRSDQAALRDGLYEEEIVPGAATKVRVQLADITAYGRIDAGETVDVAAILVGSGGGSGTFVYLAAVLNDGGGARPVASVLLGDRVGVRGIAIEDRRIAVRMRVRGSDDAFTDLTTEVTRTFALQGDDLVQLNEDRIAAPPPDPAEHGFNPQTLELGAGGQLRVAGALLPGQTGDYVVRGEAGRELEIVMRSTFNNAILSVYGLSERQVLVSVNEYRSQLKGALPATQQYAIRVVTLAGDRLEYTLDLRLGPSAAGDPSASPPAAPTATLPADLPGSRVVYLTFDDGPLNPYTSEILDLLAAANAKATFFFLGQSAQARPDPVRRAAAEGHAVANHTYSHGSIAGLDREAFFTEVAAAQAVLDELAGAAAAPCLRPPYGSTDSFTRAYAAELGYALTLWDVDPQDWSRPGAEKIVSTVLEKVEPGRIVLFHDGGGDRRQTVEALGQILETLSSQGYVFRTMHCVS